MKYMKIMAAMFKAANGKAIHMQDGVAWDNRKRKMCKRHLPRGKVFRRLDNYEWQIVTRPILNFDITNILKDLKLCACLGPQNGEPFCPCKMRDSGLEASAKWSEQEENRLNEALKLIIDAEAKP